MMKKMATLMLVLGLAAVANAGLTVVIQNDAGEWKSYEDSTFTITPSTEIVWGVQDDGQTSTTGLYVLGFIGPGSITEPVVRSDSVSAVMSDNQVMALEYGVENPFISMNMENSVNGMLFTSTFHCEGEGDVTLFAFDQNFLVADTQVIHQVPEPATLAILGLGSLFLKRRKKA